jgi:oleate hydratase
MISTKLARSSPHDRQSRPDPSTSKVYLVGGGIASMAAAAFLIRDGNFVGHNITILEELNEVGGSLDASGNATRP